MALEFRPTLKTVNIVNEDLTKITLEVKNGSLKGKLDELSRYSGKTVNITIVPEYYSYSIPFDKSTNAPTQEYVVNNDGTIDFVKKEQTQLEVDEKGNIDIENRQFMVTKEIVDEFIRAAKSLEFPGNINPRDVLTRSEDGEPFTEIAEDYEMSELNLINELEKAREYYAPYAAAWDAKRNEVNFKEPDDEEESEPAQEDHTPDDSANEDAENETDITESMNDPADSEDEDADPY